MVLGDESFDVATARQRRARGLGRAVPEQPHSPAHVVQPLPPEALGFRQRLDRPSVPAGALQQQAHARELEHGHRKGMCGHVMDLTGDAPSLGCLSLAGKVCLCSAKLCDKALLLDAQLLLAEQPANEQPGEHQTCRER